MLTLQHCLYLLPEIFIGAWITILLLYGIIFSKIHQGKFTQQIKLTQLAITILLFTVVILSWQAININEKLIFNYFTIDPITIIIKIIVLLTSMIILWLSIDRYIIEKEIIIEYPILILIATLGMMLLVSSNELIVLYLSLELISLTSYVLAGLNVKSEKSTEAGFKYFILGSLNSGILLLGMAVIYAITAETNLTNIGYYVTYASDDKLALEVAAGMILFGFLFKLAAAPFHSWAPDVYDGSNTIITAFFTIVPKIAILYTLISILFGPFLAIYSDLNIIIQLSIILCIIIGCITGLNQTKMKRLLAYSAISHVGMILLGILPGTILSIQTSIIYVIIYIVMSVNIFAILLSIFKNSTIYITELAGLSRLNPLLAITFSLVLLSLAGIPPLAGFFTKYLVLVSAIENEYLVISIIAILGSVISGFYYLRIIKWIYFKDTEDYYYRVLGNPNSLNISLTSAILISSTFFIILTFLFYPSAILTITFDGLLSSLF